MLIPSMFQAVAECGCVVRSTYDDDPQAVRDLEDYASEHGLRTRTLKCRSGVPFYCQTHDPKGASLFPSSTQGDDDHAQGDPL